VRGGGVTLITDDTELANEARARDYKVIDYDELCR
jgi:hypothetical protein